MVLGGEARVRKTLPRGWMNAMNSAEQTVAGKKPVTLQTNRDGTIVTGQFLTVADRGLHATESHPCFSVTYSGPGGETQTIRYRSDGRPFAVQVKKP
ncbi:MAG: hypothetical protein NT067_05635 [Candidatus Diapherotrites archaeon]|nr:hypothetical protein [Candidatus Diapherotrites archaeon]